MRKTILTIVLLVLAFGFLSAQAAQTGSIIGWGEQIVGVDTSAGFTTIAARALNSLGLKDDGSVVAWGWNEDGQHNVPAPNSGFVAIEAGYTHNLGLKDDGSIVAWGRNDYGQCNVPDPNGFVAIAAGFGHSLGLKDDGSVAAWGRNIYGLYNVPAPNSGFTAIAAGVYYNLGLKEDGSIVAWGVQDGGFYDYGQVSDTPDYNGFIAIVAGGYHSLGLKDDGSVVAWGRNDYGQCNVPDPNGFVGIAAGGWHSLGLKDDGSIVAWGYNDHGQCNVPAPNSGFIAIAAGGNHSLGLKDDGSVVAWGLNNYVQCNIGTPNSGFVAIVTGYEHSLGLKDDGSVTAWGDNEYGQCNEPVPNSGFIEIAGGWGHNLGLRDDGIAYAWGLNDDGQCNVPDSNSFVAIAAGWAHSLGLTNDGSILAWGYNGYGQCNVPAANSGFIAIAADGHYSLGLKDDGSIAVWGFNNAGQYNVPAPNSGFVAISAGNYHSLGLREDGSVAAWGRNDSSQCNVPSPNSGFIAVAAGSSHSMGLKEDGSVVAWGQNWIGQCDVPAPNSGFIAIAAGSGYSLGLKTCLHEPIGDIDDNCRVDLADLALICDEWLTTYFFSDVVDVAENWLAGTGNIAIELTLDNLWMYQNVGSSTNSNLTANVSIVDDQAGNSSYTYDWEIILPGDVTIEPSTISGGEGADTSWNFAAPNVNQPEGLSDSGQPLTVKVTVTGVDYANTGSAEVQFGVALLGDVNNDGVVNVADRSIINAFWRTGAAGDFTLRDCDLNCDGSINVADCSIANAIWRGVLGQNSVSNPCPFRGVAPGMVFIPGGEFEMGVHFEEGSYDERPVHAVLLDSFFMSKYEITNSQYCDYLNSAYPAQLKVVSGVVYASSDDPCDYPYCDTHSYDTDSQIDFSDPDFSVRTKDGRDMSDDPMVEVTWYGAVAYCNWKSQQEGYEACYNLSTWDCDFSKHGYRLPTEAEWEYAARGGLSGKRFPWADPNISHSQANYNAGTDYTYDLSYPNGSHPTWNDGIIPYTAPVGSFSANGYGLYDMAGNVWEWCNDWYDENYYDVSPLDNPTGPAFGLPFFYRVLRGGSWGVNANYCRVAVRYGISPDIRNYGGGFRIVLPD